MDFGNWHRRVSYILLIFFLSRALLSFHSPLFYSAKVYSVLSNFDRLFNYF